MNKYVNRLVEAATILKEAVAKRTTLVFPIHGGYRIDFVWGRVFMVVMVQTSGTEVYGMGTLTAQMREVLKKDKLCVAHVNKVIKEQVGELDDGIAEGR